jgi:hypothetical protein
MLKDYIKIFVHIICLLCFVFMILNLVAMVCLMIASLFTTLPEWIHTLYSESSYGVVLLCSIAIGVGYAGFFTNDNNG